MTDQPTADRVTALYDAIDAFQRQHRTTGGLQHAQIRALLAEHLDAALPTAPAVAPTAPPAADQPAPAPLSEVWSVWREDEPSCPDYSWDQQAGGARLELLVGGVHSGVYASRHPVYGGPAAAPVAEADAALRAEVERLRADRATTLREAAAEAEAENAQCNTPGLCLPCEVRTASATALRRMADEAQQPETEALCGNTVGRSGLHYRPCARPAGHPEAYCRDTTGQHLFLAATQPAPVLAAPPVHLPEGGNAEDCPACRQGPPLPYPWICHGQDPEAFNRRCPHIDSDRGQCTRPVDDHDHGHEYAAPAPTEASCTCAVAGPEFAPTGHYADCPHAAPAPTEEPTP